MGRYRSSIPKAATEVVVAWYRKTRQKLRSNFLLSGELVGYRMFDRDGELDREVPLRNGVTHGVMYTWSDPGILRSAQPFYNGKPHGVAKQYGRNGDLIGTWRMSDGTGLDLWRQESYEGDQPPFLTEARYLRDGKWHGFEWWFLGANGRLSTERHFHEDLQHGIEREWNHHGRIKRGYPRYWIHGKQVDKRQYLRAVAKDPSLPPFAGRDNEPYRGFPPEVSEHLPPSPKRK